MSDEQPDLLRKLLDQAAPPDADAAVAEGAGIGPRRVIRLEPDEADLVPHRYTRQMPPSADGPPAGLGRFGPAYWPWPATTRRARARNIAIVTLAVAGAVAGLFITWYHLTTDPLADAHAYYDAAVRLNRGQPLYPAGADTNAADYYRYPPLLAVVLRPAVLLGWPAFAAFWEAIVVGSFVLLLRRLGAGTKTWLALGILAMPIGWCLAIGQAQVPVTLLVAIGQPWSIALAANVKLLPALVALWWIGRRDFQATGAFIAWLILIGLAQAALELRGSIDFVKTIGFDQVGQVLNVSPYAIAPWLWAALVALGVVVTIVVARSRLGWVAAVTLATLASPRLLVYMLMGLIAAVREPPIAGLEAGTRPPQPLRYGRR